MAVPKKKTSKARRDMRRSHDGLSLIQTVTCSNCGSVRRPHHVCSHCGYYNGKPLLKRTPEKSDDDA